jgi:RimJ/RimL family protein N-acetyltransferase
VRFDRRDDGSHEVSIYLDPALPGLGLGRAVLRAGEEALAARCGAVTVHASVRAGNVASQRLFAAAGYAGGPLSFQRRLAPAGSGQNDAP